MATIRKRGGRWQAMIRRPTLKATKTFARKVDAEAWARAKEAASDRGEAVPGRMLGTLAPVIERYRRDVGPIKRWGVSKERELNTLQRDLGSWLLGDLKKAKILKYVSGLDITPGGVSSRLSYLREVLRSAAALWDEVVPLPEVEAAIFAAKHLKLAGKSQRRHRRPTTTELATIVAFADGQQGAFIELSEIVRVLSVLPLRLGELVGIRWEDLIPDRRTVILHARKHPDVIKHEGNDQEVPLIDFGGVDTWKAISGRPRHLESPFPYKMNRVSTRFSVVALKCGIRDLHLHDLRAHAISSLLEAEVPIPQVALLSGHSNWKVLARHYARLQAAKVRDTIEAAGRDGPSQTPQRTGGGGQTSPTPAAASSDGSATS